MISQSDFSKITTVILDVDGTLTDGRYALGADGSVLKFFNIHDQHWILMAMRAGLEVGLISGRGDVSNRRFAEELKLSFAYFDVHDKLAAFETLLRERNIEPSACLCVGDDVVDMPMLKRAGIGAAPADAVPELDEVISWRTQAPGGRGAVCEVLRRLLKEKGLLNSVMERYRR